MSPVPEFDELIHAPTRLSIVALLAVSEWAEFTFLPSPAKQPSAAPSDGTTTS